MLGRLAGDGPGRAWLEAPSTPAEYQTVVTPVGRSPYIACVPTLADHQRELSRNLST
jgi:hypothetical protein